MVSSALNSLKTISRICNSSCNFEQFIVNLDLINIALDEAEKMYEDNCKEIIRHMSSFWCKDYRFKFCQVFDDVKASYYADHGIQRFALPYRLWRGYDKDRYGEQLALSAINSFGKVITVNMSIDLFEDMQAIHGIDVFHECFLQWMCDLTNAVKTAGMR